MLNYSGAMRVPRKYVLAEGVAFHKIWRCHNREFLLQGHRDKHAYLGFVSDDYRKKRCRRQFVIHAYVVMSNHVHEAGRLNGDVGQFSAHMRRAHGRFGLDFNKRHSRLGKVAHDRPKTLALENGEELKQLMFYIDCNPVRAGLARHPTDVRFKYFSSCRYYCFGEKNPYSDMLTVPQWYLELGSTPEQRQKKYRSMLDRYMIEKGLKRDPRMGAGYFIGRIAWVQKKRRKITSKLRSQKSGADPPAQVQ